MPLRFHRRAEGRGGRALYDTSQNPYKRETDKLKTDPQAQFRHARHFRGASGFHRFRVSHVQREGQNAACARILASGYVAPKSVPKNLSRTAQVALPVEVVADIDRLVGKRSRSAFLTELAQREIKIRRQREVLRETAGAWKSEDHPELAQGAAAWIRQIRARDTERFDELERRRDGK